jgi:hypothetical protein
MEPVLMRAVACEWVLCALLLIAAPAQRTQTDLTNLQIEDLMNVDVTSASKKEQKLSRVPAAIFVITQEDIRRSGATNIPDLLRMVPGLEVAQVTPSVWAISARGFNSQYSNKLLVLIDGRAVYTPLFSGVYWDAQDVPLDSIERIEIIPAFLTMHLHRDATGMDVGTGPETEGGIPNQQAQLRSNVNLPWHWQWTTSAYFVGRLAAPKIASYTRLDVNLVWHTSDKMSLGVVGQNLLQDLHQEYSGSVLTVTPSLVRRSAYARLTWRF